MFGLSHALCDAYPALTPFAVDRERAGDVLELVKNYRVLSRRSSRQKNAPKRILVNEKTATGGWY
jgi:hypothetical protein